jgi:hypothetical protein
MGFHWDWWGGRGVIHVDVTKGDGILIQGKGMRDQEIKMVEGKKYLSTTR